MFQLASRIQMGKHRVQSTSQQDRSTRLCGMCTNIGIRNIASWLSECNETVDVKRDTHSIVLLFLVVQLLHTSLSPILPQTSNSTTSLRIRAPSMLPAWQLWVARILAAETHGHHTAIHPIGGSSADSQVRGRVRVSGARDTAALRSN